MFYLFAAFFFAFFLAICKFQFLNKLHVTINRSNHLLEFFFLFTSASDFAKLETTKCLTYLGADIEIDILILWCQSSAELERSSDIALIY